VADFALDGLRRIKVGSLHYLKNVVTLQMDQEKCVGCRMCLIVCPQAVFTMNKRRAIITNRDACMECGACARNCPTEALTVQAGVGCASAVINSALGRTDSACCCIIENNSYDSSRSNSSRCC
jgi:NAD-dependent dihydropyrimidine dehydrogenase PreA subunit